MSAHSHATAEAVLQRLLLVLPLAAREEGAAVDELARRLDVDPRRILRDLEELEARNFYLPPGLGDQFQLSLDRERISVWTTREFQRPVRLTPREALALELALRAVGRPGDRRQAAGPGDAADPGAAGGHDPTGASDSPEPGRSPRTRDIAGTEGRSPDATRDRFRELRARLVQALRTPNAEEVEDPAVALAGAEADDDPIRRVAEEAVREGRELRIRYRPPARDPEPRRVGPVTLAHAEGRWYLLARDLERDGHRAFRLDRILEAEATGSPFQATAADRTGVEAFFQDGRIHDGGGPDAPEPLEVVVEYSPRIARWIAERGWDGAEEGDDGSLRVRHRVVDPEWILRHVLSYGAEARVLEPAEIQERIVSIAEELESL